jgi:hypothetical protein
LLDSVATGVTLMVYSLPLRDISFRLVYLHSYSEPLSVVT